MTTTTRKRSTAAIIASSIGGLVGLAVLVAGLAVIAVHQFNRDDDGFYTSGNERVESAGYAVVTDRIDLGTEADWTPDGVIGELRLRAESPGGEELFVGIAPSDDIAKYLGGVRRSELTDIRNGDPVLVDESGGKPADPPTSEDFWVAQDQGAGERSVEWDPEGGVWTAVVMNGDASAGVTAAVDAGAKVDWLIWVGLGLTLFGLILLVPCAIVFVRSVRGGGAG